jgi:hypothetical protein
MKLELEVLDPELAMDLGLEENQGRQEEERQLALDSPGNPPVVATTTSSSSTPSVTFELIAQPPQQLLTATPFIPPPAICSTSRSSVAAGESQSRRVSRSGRPKTKRPHQCKAKVAEKMKEIEGKDRIIRAQKIAIKSYQEQLVSALQNTIRLQECIVKFNEKEVKRLRREVRRLQVQARPRVIPGSGLNRWSMWSCD